MSFVVGRDRHIFLVRAGSLRCTITTNGNNRLRRLRFNEGYGVRSFRTIGVGRRGSGRSTLSFVGARCAPFNNVVCHRYTLGYAFTSKYHRAGLSCSNFGVRNDALGVVVLSSTCSLRTRLVCATRRGRGVVRHAYLLGGGSRDSVVLRGTTDTRVGLPKREPCAVVGSGND